MKVAGETLQRSPRTSPATGSYKQPFVCLMCTFLSKVKLKMGGHEPKVQSVRAYPGFLSMKHAWEYCYSPLDGMLSKVPCLGKQRDGQDLNPSPPDPQFKVLTARPHTKLKNLNLANHKGDWMLLQCSNRKAGDCFILLPPLMTSAI